MKVIARHWVKYGGDWHRKGEVFEIDDKDAPEMKRYADLTADNGQSAKASEPQEQPKRGRRRKTDQENR